MRKGLRWLLTYGHGKVSTIIFYLKKKLLMHVINNKFLNAEVVLNKRSYILDNFIHARVKLKENKINFFVSCISLINLEMRDFIGPVLLNCRYLLQKLKAETRIILWLNINTTTFIFASSWMHTSRYKTV